MNFRSAFVVAIVAAALAFAPAAYADAVYHSEHLSLTPVAGAPLRSGFVENIHANGPTVYAHEVYALNGARPGTAYDVTLLLYPLDPSCSGSAVAIPEITLTTNRAGNAVGVNTFDVATVDSFGIRHATHGISWRVVGADGSTYVTRCTSVTLD
jgi:hypothetical protein